MTTSLLVGDCRSVLPTLPAGSVHCVATSPPYFGLRDYGTAKWDGGDPACDHLGPPMRTNNKMSNSHATFHGGTTRANEIMGQECFRCGARRKDNQIGLEQTPDEYVAALVGVFRDVRRVLRKDGTLWLNLGDSYGATGGNTYSGFNKRWNGTGGAGSKQDITLNGVIERTIDTGGLRPKNLLGIPWRVAFALQADGWYLRQDIIWSKPNPMPESVRDRCTKAHEYLFLLSKSERYYFDANAIAEPVTASTIERVSQPTLQQQEGSWRVPGKTNGAMKAVDPGPSRNKRSVWEIATQPYADAHFATFPPALIEPCIKAGTSEKGCCAKCGAPWVRETQRTAPTYWEQRKTHDYNGRKAENGPNDNYKSISRGHPSNSGVGYNHSETVGWSPSCSCNAAVVPCTVLDPFGGAGTTGLVADRLQRNAVLIELNRTYAGLAEGRIKGEAPLFADINPLMTEVPA